MSEPTTACTPTEAKTIIRVDLPQAMEAKSSVNIAKCVARLQTLSDTDLTALAVSDDAFAMMESNRRLSAALLQEAARTTRLTRWVVGLTAAVLALTAVLLWRTH
jgi:hypothetical protein